MRDKRHRWVGGGLVGAALAGWWTSLVAGLQSAADASTVRALIGAAVSDALQPSTISAWIAGEAS